MRVLNESRPNLDLCSTPSTPPPVSNYPLFMSLQPAFQSAWHSSSHQNQFFRGRDDRSSAAEVPPPSPSPPAASPPPGRGEERIQVRESLRDTGREHECHLRPWPSEVGCPHDDVPKVSVAGRVPVERVSLEMVSPKEYPHGCCPQKGIPGDDALLSRAAVSGAVSGDAAVPAPPARWRHCACKAARAPTARPIHAAPGAEAAPPAAPPPRPSAGPGAARPPSTRGFPGRFAAEKRQSPALF